MSSNTRKQLENWLKTISVKGTVLDVGGTAMSVKGRTKNWKVSNYKILDHHKADYIGDINSFTEELPEFDIVFCLEVMEYIWNPLMTLSTINSFLKLNGILYISFHFLFPHHNPANKDYLRYTKRGIEKILEETGFEIKEIIPRTTRVPDILKKFCQAESKVYKHPNEIGYLVKAKKIWTHMKNR